AVNLELGSNLFSPTFKTRIYGLDVYTRIPASPSSVITTMSASMTGRREPGGLHLGSRGDGSISRGGLRNGARRNAVKVVVVGIVIEIVSVFFLLCKTGIARRCRSIFRHNRVCWERSISYLWVILKTFGGKGGPSVNAKAKKRAV